MLYHQGWAAAGRDQPAHRPGHGSRLPIYRYREPRLRPGQGRGSRNPRPRTARQALPACGSRDPDRTVPGSADSDVRQPGPVGGRRRPRLHLPVGAGALAGSATEDRDHRGDRASCGGGGDRTTLAWASGPAAARCAPHPPADGCRGELPARPTPIPRGCRTRPARAAPRRPHLGHKTGCGNREWARGPGGRGPFAATRQPRELADARGAVIAASLACTCPNAIIN
jgi:hypothetical protein